MKVVENGLSDTGAIVEMAEACRHLFMSYPEVKPKRLFDPYREAFDQSDDRFHVLRMGYNMPDEMAAAVANRLGMNNQDKLGDIRICRYDVGDYLQPKRSLGAMGIYLLTSSPVDGLTVADGNGGFVKINDKAGTQIITDRGAWHWVDPVRAGPRYTIVTDPPVRGHPPTHSAESGNGSDNRRRGARPTPPRTLEVVGRGACSVVYATENPYRVLKTCLNTRAYDAFLRFAERRLSQHLPRIFASASNPDGRQWIEMERLEPLNLEEVQWPVINAFADFCHAVVDRRPVTPPPELNQEQAKLARDLGEQARRHDVSLDLSPVNVMIRPKSGEFVIVDPFW